ncbi:uncharacterized protein TNCV_3799771 [Trichonephila clavipes]|nr:uncharacterized protein TNCV_3799771 [Trichonephila clavipes]
MKDELSYSLALEFVGLKPKMYSLKSAEMEKKTAKGVSKIIIQQQIRHTDYKETLLCRRRGLSKAKKIASHNHIVQTVAYQKSTLSPFDSKRYILQDGINTLAYELAEELGLIVEASLTKPKLKDLIVKSPDYIEDDVKVMIDSIVKDRIRTEEEKLRREQ